MDNICISCTKCGKHLFNSSTRGNVTLFVDSDGKIFCDACAPKVKLPSLATETNVDQSFAMPKFRGGRLSKANEAKAATMARDNVPIEVISLVTRHTVNTIRNYLTFKDIPIPNPKRPAWMTEGFLFFNGYANTEYVITDKEIKAWKYAHEAGASAEEIARAYGRSVQSVKDHLKVSGDTTVDTKLAADIKNKARMGYNIEQIARKFKITTDIVHSVLES